MELVPTNKKVAADIWSNIFLQLENHYELAPAKLFLTFH